MSSLSLSFSGAVPSSTMLKLNAKSSTLEIQAEVKFCAVSILEDTTFATLTWLKVSKIIARIMYVIKEKTCIEKMIRDVSALPQFCLTIFWL